MKTKDSIKEKGRLLFNQQGVRNITLREIANQLGKSYGNITYYYGKKEKLILDLFSEMNEELAQLQRLYSPDKNLLEFFLMLPNHSFDITLKYLFFSKDFVELKRNYPDFFKIVDSLNAKRKTGWLTLLKQLQAENYLKSSLSVADLEYIMELSVSIRTFYFQNQEWDQFEKSIYIEKVNKLIYPYLTEKGERTFAKFNL